MKILPAATEHVEIPESFSPSQLIYAQDCRLRAVLGATGDEIPRLPIHPAAVRGKVFHALLEKAARGDIAHSGTRPVYSELERLIKEAETSLGNSPETAHFARLEETLSYLEWHNVVQRILAAADKLLNATGREMGEKERPVEGPKARTLARDWPSDGCYPELGVDARSIRLRGRLDQVEFVSHDNIIVRDYKTGRITDKVGTIRPEIVLQLHLYTLAISSIRPSAAIRTVVSNGEQEHTVSIGGDDLARTWEWLTSFLDTLPAGTIVPARELASPGRQCRTCQNRHVCPSYLEGAPTLWREGTEEGPLPNDTWGEVTAIEMQDDLVTVELRDASSRRVKVHRLCARHGLVEKDTRDLYFFGLSSSGRNVAGGRFFGQRNFFEMPSAVRSERAWSLAVFAHPTARG